MRWRHHWGQWQSTRLSCAQAGRGSTLRGAECTPPQPRLTSQPHAVELPLSPREPFGLWGMALKTCKDQTVYCREWFIFIRQCLRSPGSEGVLVTSPGLCYKSYCMSGASQNPTPTMPACWEPPERNKGGERRGREGEFGLPLVKPDRSSFHLLAEAVQLEQSPRDAETTGLS